MARLAALVDRAARKGVRGLPPDEIDELALAYRATTSDLAIARTRGEDPVVLDHLITANNTEYGIYLSPTTGAEISFSQSYFNRNGIFATGQNIRIRNGLVGPAQGRLWPPYGFFKPLET